MDYKLIEQFNLFWDLFQVDETRYPRRRACCIKLWVDMPADRRDAILDDLRRNGKPKQGNPFFFIQDFQVRNHQRPPGQPKFLHGRELYDAMNRGEYLVQVDIPERKEGRYPIVTKEDADRFGLKIEKDWMKKIEN